MSSSWASPCLLHSNRGLPRGCHFRNENKPFCGNWKDSCVVHNAKPMSSNGKAPSHLASFEAQCPILLALLFHWIDQISWLFWHLVDMTGQCKLSFSYVRKQRSVKVVWSCKEPFWIKLLLRPSNWSSPHLSLLLIAAYIHRTLSRCPNTVTHSVSKHWWVLLLRARRCAWLSGENKHVSQTGALLIKQGGPDWAHSSTKEIQNQSYEVTCLDHKSFQWQSQERIEALRPLLSAEPTAPPCLSIGGCEEPPSWGRWVCRVQGSSSLYSFSIKNKTNLSFAQLPYIKHTKVELLWGKWGQGHWCSRAQLFHRQAVWPWQSISRP